MWDFGGAAVVSTQIAYASPKNKKMRFVKGIGLVPDEEDIERYLSAKKLEREQEEEFMLTNTQNDE